MTGLRYVLAVIAVVLPVVRPQRLIASRPLWHRWKRSIALSRNATTGRIGRLPMSVSPKVAEGVWSTHPIDCFLKAQMDERAVAPLPRVSRTTLLRRVTFDLTGLPPTPLEISVFLTDQSADSYEKLVDRLLASPAYGERWAQHWLDVARFAETDGFEFDTVRPNAWRYRDWVIDALNRDMPYDQFLRLQLAGDELDGTPESAIATGFLLCGPDMPDLNLKEERLHIVLNEMAATVGSVFLRLQVGCGSVPRP